MEDSLAPLLHRLDLRSRVFFAGNLCSLVHFDPADGVGHLHVLKAGRLRLTGPDGATQVLDEPSLVFFPRASRHRLAAEAGDGADLVCASVDLGRSLGHPLVQSLPPLLVVPLDAMPGLAGVLQALFAEAFAEARGREAALSRLVELVLIHLLRHGIEQGLLRDGALAGLADPKLARALTALHTEPAHPWTLQSLADLAGMSRARFAAQFAQVVGRPAIDYLADWRLTLAQGLLLQGEPVKRIADEVGYGSPNALARAFTQRLGRAPMAWLAAQRAV